MMFFAHLQLCYDNKLGKHKTSQLSIYELVSADNVQPVYYKEGTYGYWISVRHVTVTIWSTRIDYLI